MWTVLTKCVLSISLKNFSKPLELPNSANFQIHLKSKDEFVAFYMKSQKYINQQKWYLSKLKHRHRNIEFANSHIFE